MPRTFTAPETTLLTTAAKRLSYKVEITDAAGAFVDYTALLGADWVVRVGGGKSLDEPIPTFELEVRRDHDGDSLSPFRSDSVLNTGGAAIDGRRLVRISTAYSAWGAAPAPGDYRIKELGIIDTPDFSGVNAKMAGRNYTGARLVDAQVRGKYSFGEEGGRLLHLVMQDVLDELMPGMTLDVIDTPAFVVTPYPVDPDAGKVWDVLRALAGLIGWDVRILFNETAQEFRPALVQPDRTQTVPDYTLDPAFVYQLEQLSIDTTWIRNVVRVTFENEDGEPDFVEVSDAASIARFNGELYAEIVRGSGSPIDTTAEATDLANAALSDLSWPIADQVLVIPYFFHAELGDLVRASANGIHYNGNLDLAVTADRWEIAPKSARTWLTTRGQPAGFYKSWIRHETRLNVGIELLSWDPVHDDPTGDTVTYRGQLQGTEAWVYEKLAQQPVPIDVWDDIENVNYLTDALLPDADKIITDVYNAPPEGWLRYVFVRPYRVAAGVYTAGNPKKAIVFDKKAQAPVVEVDDSEDGITGYAFLKLHDRGIPVTSVQAQTQVGTDPPSLLIAPLRDAGDTSVVKARAMVSDEYEHEVPLGALGRQAWIYFHVALATGETLVVPFPGFDQGRTPDFMAQLYFIGTVLYGLTGDQDTVAIIVELIGSSWRYEIDYGASAPIDLSQNDPDGNAGATSGIVRVTLSSDPIDDIDGDTLTAVRELTFGASGEPVWQMGAKWVTPPLVDSQTLQINLDADSAPAGYTAKVFARYQDGSEPWTDFVDISASLAPALSAPPTALTNYFYSTGLVRISKDTTQPVVTYEVRAEIRNASDVVVASLTGIPAQWYHEGAGA